MPHTKLNVQQRAEKLTSDFADKTGAIDVDGHYAEALAELAHIALKEQDRDTRHACAEAVLECHDYNDLNGDSDLQLIDATDAHDACMNNRSAEQPSAGFSSLAAQFQPQDSRYATVTVFYWPEAEGFHFPALYDEVPSLRNKTSNSRVYTQYAPDSPTLMGRIEETMINLMMANHVDNISRLPDVRGHRVFSVTFLKSNRLLLSEQNQ